MLEAAYILEHHIHADVTIVVVGAARSPRYQKVLNQLTRQLSLSGVRLWGEVSDATLAELYGRAGAFVTVSEHEGLCVPPLEAMAFGVPVLARRYDAVPETVGDAALLLDPGSGPVEVAEGIVEMMENRPLVETLISRGHERTEQFDQYQTDLKFLGVIETVV